jgi:hypothetical protein
MTSPDNAEAAIERERILREDEWAGEIEWGDNDTALACGLENPTACESCQ